MSLPFSPLNGGCNSNRERNKIIIVFLFSPLPLPVPTTSQEPFSSVQSQSFLHSTTEKSKKKKKKKKKKRKRIKMDSDSLTTTEIVSKLKLQPHPEGGFYSETFRDESIILRTSNLPSQYKVDRPVSTSIYFLLPSGNVSLLHRIPMAETWHHYMGEPLTVVELNEETNEVKMTVLGPDIHDNQQPQYTVPPYVWFGSFPTKDYEVSPNGALHRAAPRDAEKHFSLVGCTCAPAFQFEDFELGNRSELINLFPNMEPFISLLTLPK